VDLAWSASSGATSYRVKRATSSDGPYATIASVTGTGYADTAVTPGVRYHYLVTAVNAAGGSLNSNAASAVPVAAVPAAPTNLTATAVNTDRVRLSWTDRSGDESGFHVWSSRDGKSWRLATTVAPAPGTGSIVQFATGRLRGTWFFRVTSYNAAGDSAPTNAVSRTIALLA
jgi:cellulose 1,4-beta-cellobiosidase